MRWEGAADACRVRGIVASADPRSPGGQPEDLRSIVFELRSDHLEEGPATAIGAATRDQALQAGIAHRVTGRLAAEPPLEVSLALYRIAQEALTNVRKHGRASRVEVSLAEEGGAVGVRVADAGWAFEVAEVVGNLPRWTPRRARRFGLRSMRERAQLAGGQLTIMSVPGQGTVVEARIPVAVNRLPGPQPEARLRRLEPGPRA